MSYDIRLVDESGKQLYLEFPHDLKGGTYAVGGTRELWLNVTYNYRSHFYRLLGEKGIRSLYGLRAKETITMLESAISKLSDDVDPDYWKATEGNARRALENLLTLARAAPDGIWDGD